MARGKKLRRGGLRMYVSVRNGRQCFHSREFRALERAYPGYQLTDCKGYPTPGHLEALTRLGPSPVHRMSFEPVRRVTIIIQT